MVLGFRANDTGVERLPYWTLIVVITVSVRESITVISSDHILATYTSWAVGLARTAYGPVPAGIGFKASA